MARQKERRNIQEAFTVLTKKRDILKDKEILLIDDIFTTGSTVDACSAALLEAGAAKVLVFAFAAGANLLKGDAGIHRRSVRKLMCN